MIKHHSDMVRRLAKDGDLIAQQLTGHDAHLLHMVVGVSGEAGELLDAVKKVVIYRKPLDIVNVIEELGDLEFYMEGLRQGLGITREQCLAANIGKLEGGKNARYKDGYSDKAAQERADKAAEEPTP
ncbi:MAG: nucleoside triphosphate pyrophosphohydrolase family protein [Gallionella sp.]|nr:nucleoside triphosphate pyrophosphohydrolase family protein [Gallionella sp.]